MEKKKATKDQRDRIDGMLKSGLIDRDEAQEIIKKPRSNAFPAHHYRIHVSYAKLPGVRALQEKFSGRCSVSGLFDGRPWERHSSCAKIVMTPGERVFRVAVIPTEFYDKPIAAVRSGLAAHFGREGYRFAIETEAVEFACAKIELQWQSGLSRVALGSSAFNEDGLQCVARLSSDHGSHARVVGGGRTILAYNVGQVLDSYDRLLLVCIRPSAKWK